MDASQSFAEENAIKWAAADYMGLRDGTKAGCGSIACHTSFKAAFLHLGEITNLALKAR